MRDVNLSLGVLKFVIIEWAQRNFLTIFLQLHWRHLFDCCPISWVNKYLVRLIFLHTLFLTIFGKKICLFYVFRRNGYLEIETRDRVTIQFGKNITATFWCYNVLWLTAYEYYQNIFPKKFIYFVNGPILSRNCCSNFFLEKMVERPSDECRPKITCGYIFNL